MRGVVRRACLLLGLGWLSTQCVALTGHDGPWACSVASDCLTGETCAENEAGKRICVSIDACATNRPCPEGQACAYAGFSYFGRCVVAQCVVKSDSACGGFQCDTSTFTCRSSCALYGCAAGFNCVRGNIDVCVRGSCDPAATGECGGNRCQSDGLCALSCATSADCESGYCKSGHCD